jgi:monofunctional biosynthetic peptidoglycan transglycosylase
MSGREGEIRIATGRGRSGGGSTRTTSKQRYREHRSSQVHAVAQRVKPVVIIAFVLWLLTVLVLRFAAPPVTTLVIVRQVQSLFTSHVGMREWNWIESDELPVHVLQAVVTAEDARFMQHMGVDLLAVGDALDSVGGKRKLRGASTITMQTVKNIYLWPGRSYIRKAVEWFMAPIAGPVWGKKRTLELYLNVIEWGEGIYGIESAARYYYRKSASKLSVHEAAALAAILPNPRKLSPLVMVQSTRRRYGRIVRELHMTPVPGQKGGRGPRN